MTSVGFLFHRCFLICPLILFSSSVLEYHIRFGMLPLYCHLPLRVLLPTSVLPGKCYEKDHKYFLKLESPSVYILQVVPANMCYIG